MVNIDGIIDTLFNNWYWFVITILGFLVVVFLIKVKKLKVERHSEVKEHHEIVNEELLLNLSKLGGLYQGDTKKGNIKSLSTKIRNISTRIKKKTKDGDKESVVLEKHKFYIFNYKPVAIDFILFKLCWGKQHLVVPAELIKFDWSRKRAILRSDVSIDKFLGYASPDDEKTKLFIFSEFYRTLTDKAFDGFGRQMLNFSEVRDMWAHDLSLKEKEIEKIKEEKKLMGTRSR